MSIPKINTKNLFPNISETCKNCNTCCNTYGWLLKRESEKFIKNGYPIVQINKSLFCIDSFKMDSKGNLILDKIPRCKFYKQRQCLIQDEKPFDCKIFPIKVKFYEDTCILGLSLGCKYISNLNDKEKNKLYKRVISFINNYPKKELIEYLDLMYKVYLISKPKRFWMKKLMSFKKNECSWNLISLHN